MAVLDIWIFISKVWPLWLVESIISQYSAQTKSDHKKEDFFWISNLKPKPFCVLCLLHFFPVCRVVTFWVLCAILLTAFTSTTPTRDLFLCCQPRGLFILSINRLTAEYLVPNRGTAIWLRYIISQVYADAIIFITSFRTYWQ